MADFTGNLVASYPDPLPIGGLWANQVTRSMQALGGAYPFLLEGGAEAKSGPYQGNATGNPPATRPGQIVAGPGTDLFTGLVVLPAKIDLGTVLSPERKAYSVWNAGYSAQQLNAVDPSGEESLTFFGWLDAPKSFAPFESIEISFEASPVGPPAINATIDYLADSGTARLSIIGTRVTTFALLHNWETPVRESWTWNVQDLSAYDGAHQGQMMSSKPRATMQTEHLLGLHERRRVDAFFWGNVNREFLLPLWQDMSYLTQPAPAGELTLWLDTRGRRFQAGKALTLISLGLLGEAVEIEEVFDDHVTLVERTTINWPARAQAAPGVAARLAGPIQAEQINTEVQRMKLTWDLRDLPLLPPVKDFSAPGTSISPTLKARASNDAVEYPRPADWAKPVAEALSVTYLDEPFPLQVRDYRERKSAWNAYAKTFQWTLLTRSAAGEHLSWLSYLQGQYNEFFISSQTVDLVLVDQVPEGTRDSLQVEFVNYAGDYAGLPGRSAVLVKYWANSGWHRHISDIVGWATAGGVDTLTLGLALEFPILPEHVSRTTISFVYLAADAGNEITVEWLSPVIARHTMTAKLRVI